MKLFFWLLPLAAIAGGIWYLNQLRNAPPEVQFTKAQRGRLTTIVSTNGKVEPLDWTALRSEREGTVTRVAVERGQTIAQGSVIAELDAADARSELASAESRITAARADLDLLQKGGRVRDIAEINAAMDRAKLDLTIAQRRQDSLQRLVDKKAATQYDLDQVKERMEILTAELRSLETRRTSFVSPQDKIAAQARLREAETIADSARRRIHLSVIRAPIAGTLYQLDIRKGGYVRPGDLVAQIGRLDRVRVIVYVDEPELGNIRIHLPVDITWDALPGKRWSGTVEKLPSQIIALNSRQVGEVACIIDNPEKLLIPQTNVNAEVRTNVVDNALTIPKEALRRERNETGVYTLQPDNRIAWRKVRLGAASITRLEVLEGLKDQDQVALPTDLQLQDGLTVKPVVASSPVPRPS